MSELESLIDAEYPAKNDDLQGGEDKDQEGSDPEVHRVERLYIFTEINDKPATNLVTKKEYTIHFKCNFKTEKVSANNIRWIEAMGDYVKIVTSKKTYMVLSTMKSFLDKLPHGQFVRIHKSYIINLNKVINFTTNTVNTDGKCLPLSRKQKGEFKETYLNFQ